MTPFSSPGPGQVAITWLGAHGVKLAAGQLVTIRPGKTVVKVRLTNNGERILRRARRELKLRINARFTDAAGHSYSTSKMTVLRRTHAKG
jgi:hypothetical protein